MRDFLKRRIVRLHPMVVLGSVLGAVTFLIQGSVQWDGTHVPFGMVMLAMLLGMFLIPAYPGAPYEVRGNNEMYPLNGPSWSLFFEYIGNILYALAGGVVDPLPEDAPQFVKDYYAYYKTPRGYHKRSLNSNGGWNRTSALSFLNMPILSYAGEIRSAVLLVHGENAHSRYFSEDTYKKLKGDNKRLMIIPGAVHTDLYDNMDKIPFTEIAAFYNQYLR